MHFVPESISQYSLEHSKGQDPLMEELITRTKKETALPQMLCGLLEGRLLKFLVETAKPKLAVEVGTFTGYSSLWIASGLCKQSRLITCEIDPKHASIAQGFFERSPVGSKIDLKLAPALETLAEIQDPIDFAFIDADKENYPHYYEAIINKSQVGSILVVDNCLWSGEILNPESAAAKAVHQLNTKMKEDPRIENLLLPVRDGIQIARVIKAP